MNVDEIEEDPNAPPHPLSCDCGKCQQMQNRARWGIRANTVFRCKGKTVLGRRCLLRVDPPEQFCFIHKKGQV